MSAPPRLYHFKISHYAEKVRWTLDHKRVAHTRVALVPGWHLRRVRKLTGQDAVPILELDGRIIHDSTAIIAELEQRYPDPTLYPADPAERARALALEEYFDEEVAPDLRRLFWSCYLPDGGTCTRMATDGKGALTRIAWRASFLVMRPIFRRRMGVGAAEVAAARERLPGHFDRLEAELQPSGFLVGDRLSIADVTAAAVMTAILRPPEFSYPLPEPWPRALVELRDSVAHRAGSRWVCELYARHRGASAEVTAPA